MRLPRTDLIPVLAIIAGGAMGMLTFGLLLLLSPSDDALAPDPVVTPAATEEMVIVGVRMQVDGYPDVTARSIEVDGMVITGTRIEVDPGEISPPDDVPAPVSVVAPSGAEEMAAQVGYRGGKEIERVSPLNQSPSKPATSVFDAAEEELVARGHESVRAEHILLGVLGLDAGEASAALDALRVDRSAVRHHLDVMIPPRALRERQGEYPVHASGVAVIQQAMTEARGSGIDQITSAHVLLGAIEAHGPNSQALEDSGVPVDALIRELRARAKNPE